MGDREEHRAKMARKRQAREAAAIARKHEPPALRDSGVIRIHSGPHYAPGFRLGKNKRVRHR